VVLDFLAIFTWSLYIETKCDSIAGKGILGDIQKPHEWSGSSSVLILGVVVVFF
jgi:hypothetical protein